MGLGDRHKTSLVGSILALASILLFTALVPGHLVSRATALLGTPDFGPVAEMACHNSSAMPVTLPDPDGSGAPQEKCPFCKGYAAFMSALVGAPDACMIDAERVRIAVASVDDDAIEHIAKHTNNRGPPRLL